MYRRVFLGSLVFMLVFILSGPCFGEGFHFGIISAVKSKISKLKEEIQPEPTHFQSETGTDGIAQFTLEDGQTASVKAIDQRTGDPLSGIDAYLITNGTDGAYLLVDPEGEYAPRIINAINPAPESSEWIGRIRENFLHSWGSLMGFLTGEPHVLTMDRIPPDLREYIQEHFFTWWRDTIFESLEWDLYEYIEIGVDAGIGIVISLLLTPAGGAGIAFGIVSTVVSAGEILQTGSYDWWTRYYYNLGYDPSDRCEIWKASLPIFDPQHRGLIACILVVPKEPLPEWATTGSISGRATNARTGEALANVKLDLTPASLVTYSQSNGSYIFSDVPVIENMQSPYYTITATKVGYDLNSISNVQVSVGVETSDVNISLNPIVSPSEEYRIVLTWGENPRDIDSHFWTPFIEGQTYHIYYVTRGNYDDLDSPPYADLDVDDVTSYGPETITIKRLYPGTYTYAVYHYAGSATITTSGAVVRVYDDIGLVREFSVPTTSSGSNWWWRVFTLNGSTGQIAEVNTITSNPPIAYTLAPSKSK